MSSRLLLLLLVLGCAAHLCAQDALTLLRKLDEGFSAVFDAVAPSVVVIEATKAERAEELRPFEFFDRDDEQFGSKGERDWSRPAIPARSEGSGFVIRPNGYILTNRHVVSATETLEVRAFDGRRWDATVIAEDERTDIAVVKIDADDLKPIRWGDSDELRIGQLVCAIGAPFSQHFSFTCGWVSGKQRNNLLGGSAGPTLFEDYIQTDAFINPGNSGGPLFDVEGRVVGMNTLVNGLGRGLAFAIPSNLLRDAAEQLISTGRIRRPWLGVRITSLHEDRTLRAQFPGFDYGSVVRTLEAGTPAAKSDLRPGDLVTAVDGVPLHAAHDLVRYVQRQKIGQTLRLSVIRKGTELTVPVQTVEQPEPQAAGEKTSRTAPGWGMELKDQPNGALVADVLPGSPAARAELRPGDIITEVGAESVIGGKAVVAAIARALAEEPQKGALIRFLRGGKKSWGIIERTSP